MGEACNALQRAATLQRLKVRRLIRGALGSFPEVLTYRGARRAGVDSFRAPKVTTAGPRFPRPDAQIQLFHL